MQISEFTAERAVAYLYEAAEDQIHFNQRKSSMKITSRWFAMLYGWTRHYRAKSASKLSITRNLKMNSFNWSPQNLPNIGQSLQ